MSSHGGYIAQNHIVTASQPGQLGTLINKTTAGMRGKECFCATSGNFNQSNLSGH